MRTLILPALITLGLSGCADKVLVICECPPGNKDCRSSAEVIHSNSGEYTCPPGATIRATVLGAERAERADGGAR